MADAWHMYCHSPLLCSWQTLLINSYSRFLWVTNGWYLACVPLLSTSVLMADIINQSIQVFQLTLKIFPCASLCSAIYNDRVGLKSRNSLPTPHPHPLPQSLALGSCAMPCWTHRVSSQMGHWDIFSCPLALCLRKGTAITEKAICA